jgi:V8-like Glu-specific endopeptidase
MIMWDQPARYIWRDVLTQARFQGTQTELLGRVKIVAPQVGIRIDELLRAQPIVAAPVEAGDQGPAWKNFSDDGADEKLIVENDDTLLGIAFLHRGLQVARSVCRIRAAFGKSDFYGSGFRVADDLILTNHHVLHNMKRGDEPATAVEAWFNYELDWDRHELTHLPVECDPASVVGEKEHDWSVIRVSAPIPDQYPPVDLAGIGEVNVDDRVYIIQHPDGLPKMVGMQHNVVRYVDADLMQYWTDTKNGSSGSPVFDEKWRLVGLHHRWVKREVGGRLEYRNQGRRMTRVLERMRALGVGPGL